MLLLRRHFSDKVLTYNRVKTLKPTIKDLLQVKKAPKDKINVQGWVKSFRSLKNVSFIDLQDGTTNTSLKIVIPNKQEDLGTRSSLSLKIGQSINIENANWKWTPERKQTFELLCSKNDITVVGDVTDEYPLQKKHTSLKQLRQWPLWKHRTTYLGGLMRFRSYLEDEITSIFAEEGILKVQPPILTSSDCEGGGQLFCVESKASSKVTNSRTREYFGKNTYLSVSTQLHLEILALALNNVWSLNPCFRAEESDTRRHLAEFWMLEVELCNMNNLELIEFVQFLIKKLVLSLITNGKQLLPSIVPQEGAESKEEVLKLWNDILKNEWGIISYNEAIKLLQEQHSKESFLNAPKWGENLQTEHEKWLAETKFAAPVFVTDYPKDCKAFYMKLNSDMKTVSCFDLLVPKMGEIVGGSVREEDYQKLINEMKHRKMNIENLEWYTQLRKQGSRPHGGFGIGIERLVSWLYGAHNIRDAIPFYRAATSNIEL